MTLLFKKRQEFTKSKKTFLGIRKLVFSHYFFGRKEFDRLCEVLRSETKITHLKFVNVVCGYDATTQNFEPIFDALCTNKNITKLCFDYIVNMTSVVDMRWFLLYLENTKTLQHLKLINQDTDMVEASFPLALSRNTSLKRLCLSQIYLTRQDYKVIFGEKSSLHLEELELVDVNLTFNHTNIITKYINRINLYSLKIDNTANLNSDLILDFLRCIAQSKLKKLSMRNVFYNRDLLIQARDILRTNRTLIYMSMFSQYVRGVPLEFYESFDNITRSNYMRDITLFEYISHIEDNKIVIA